MADAELARQIVEDTKEREFSLKELSDKYGEKYSRGDIVESVTELVLANQLYKVKKDREIYFSFCDGNREILYNRDEVMEDLQKEKGKDYHNVSRLARKFRSCRYSVERDKEAKNGLVYSLYISKNDSAYFIEYASRLDFFKQPDVFKKMLENDDSVRIVTPTEATKLSISKRFDSFVLENYAGGYQEFRKKNSFHILTTKQFFQKTTWKTLLE